MRFASFLSGGFTTTAVINPPLCLGEEESNFDDEYVEKNVQLVRGSSFRNDMLQNPYFSKLSLLRCDHFALSLAHVREETKWSQL